MRHTAAFYAAQALSVARVVMATFFVSIAFRVSTNAALVYYLLMLVTDVVDGVVARAFDCDTKGGAWLDSVADRAVCIACAMFGVFVGVSPGVCCVFLLREVVFASLVAIVPELNDSLRVRFIGLGAGVPLRVVTAFAILMRPIPALRDDIETLYGMALAMTLIAIPARLWHVRHDLTAVFRVRRRATLLTAAAIRVAVASWARPAANPQRVHARQALSGSRPGTASSPPQHFAQRDLQAGDRGGEDTDRGEALPTEGRAVAACYISSGMTCEVVLTTVVTRHLIDEYRLFRESFRIHHGFEPVSLVRCDAASLPYVESLPNTIAILAVHGDDRPVSQCSGEFRAIVRHKMLAMSDAWRLLSPAAVAFIDADMVALRPFAAAFRDFPAPVTLSPHYWTYDHERRSAEYGFYNAGLVLSRDPRFAEWWLDAFDEQPELFGDQGCLNAVPEAFATDHFPQMWNVGYWRHRKIRDDVPPIPEAAFMFHAHVFAAARAENPYEVAQKRFVAAALDFLAQRGTPADRDLLELIATIDAPIPHTKLEK